MSSINEMMQSEEFQAVRKGTLDLLNNMDSEEVEEALREQGYGEATEKIDMDLREVETNLEIISALVQDLQNKFPEAFQELEEHGEIPEEVELPPAEKEESESSKVNREDPPEEVEFPLAEEAESESSTVNREDLRQADSTDNHGNSITD